MTALSRFSVTLPGDHNSHTVAWQVLEMAEMYRLVIDFRYHPRRDVFEITDADGETQEMPPDVAADRYTDAIADMVGRVVDSPCSGPEFSTEVSVTMTTPPVPYVPNLYDRHDVFGEHWRVPA